MKNINWRLIGLQVLNVIVNYATLGLVPLIAKAKKWITDEIEKEENK